MRLATGFWKTFAAWLPDQMLLTPAFVLPIALTTAGATDETIAAAKAAFMHSN
jgi:hypothetical protein